MTTSPFKAVEDLGTEMRNCAAHGTYESKGAKVIGNVVWSSCPKCDAESAERERRDEFNRRMASKLEKAGVPKRFVDKDFSNYRVDEPGQTRALMTCKAYAKDFGTQKIDGRCLVLVGTAGTGKTHLAMAIVKEVSRQGFSAKYTTVHECIESIRATWRSDSTESEGAVVKRLAEVDLLVLDEVGVQYGKESEQIEMFKILNKRYNAVLPTVVISNVTVEEVKGYLGERVYDRLRENEGKVVEFKWDSERGK